MEGYRSVPKYYFRRVWDDKQPKRRLSTTPQKNFAAKMNYVVHLRRGKQRFLLPSCLGCLGEEKQPHAVPGPV